MESMNLRSRALANCAVLLLLCASRGLAQTANIVTGAGLRAPVPIRAAPGELTTIFVEGIGAGLSKPIVATSVPLPTELGGITIELRQTVPPQEPITVPLLAVFPVYTCLKPDEAGCGRLTGINLQMPFEMIPWRTFGPVVIESRARVVVSENGVPGAALEIIPIVDHIRISRMGDTLNALGESNTDPSPIAELFPLPPVVAHADGSLVTATTPAKPGETLVLYAVGLGPTTPTIKSGEAAPVPAPSSYVALRFDFSPDAGPSFARLVEPLLASVAASGGASPNLQVGEMTPAFLTPGYVGLYQVNFVVPEPPAGYQNGCFQGALRSNLTVSIGVLYSYDGAGICVEVPVGASATSSTGPNVTR